MHEYRTIRVSSSAQVATITIIPEEERAPGGKVDHHWEVATAFSDLRADNIIRVIVLTGSGGVFCTSPRTRPSSGTAQRSSGGVDDLHGDHPLPPDDDGDR